MEYVEYCLTVAITVILWSILCDIESIKATLKEIACDVKGKEK